MRYRKGSAGRALTIPWIRRVIRLLPVVVSLAAALGGCGGGGGGGGEVGTTVVGPTGASSAPTITSVTTSPTSIPPGGSATITFRVSFTDPEGDLGGAATELVVCNPFCSSFKSDDIDEDNFSGTTQNGTITIFFTTNKTGEYSFTLTDNVGNRSNTFRLTIASG